MNSVPSSTHFITITIWLNVFSSSLVPRPSTSFPSLQYRKAEEGLVHFLTWMTSRTGQIRRTWASHKHFVRTHALECNYSESKDGKARRRIYVALHKTVGRTEFYHSKTVKSHSNILVMLAHVQLKFFYPWHDSREKMYQALYRFSILQATGSCLVFILMQQKPTKTIWYVWTKNVFADPWTKSTNHHSFSLRMLFSHSYSLTVPFPNWGLQTKHACKL